jgi:MFS family permease
MISLIIGMTALGLAHGYAMMAVYAVGVGIGYGLSFVAATMLLLTYFGKRAYLELYSIMCLISTAAAIGPAVGGWARDTLGSFEGVFYLCALAALIMLVATAFMKTPVIAGKAGAALEPGHGV